MNIKTKTLLRHWLLLILVWVAISYFYFFLTWVAFSNQLKPSVLTSYLETGYAHLEIVMFGCFLGLLFGLIDTISDTAAVRRKALIRACFYDLTDIILNHKAHIYQYVGDEVVLSWKEKDGLDKLACFELFFAFDNAAKKAGGLLPQSLRGRTRNLRPE